MKDIQWLFIGHIDDLEVKRARKVHIGDLVVAIFKTEDHQVFALRDKCPHKNGPISEGIVHGTKVTCPLHEWVIDLLTGEAEYPDIGCSRFFPTQIRDGKVYLAYQEEEEKHIEPAANF